MCWRLGLAKSAQRQYVHEETMQWAWRLVANLVAKHSFQQRVVVVQQQWPIIRPRHHLPIARSETKANKHWLARRLATLVVDLEDTMLRPKIVADLDEKKTIESLWQLVRFCATALELEVSMLLGNDFILRPTLKDAHSTSQTPKHKIN